VASGPVERRAASIRSRKVALTFDDGPAAITAGFLDLLRRHHARATFFVLGQQVAGHQALLRRMLREGSSIGNHSFNHANLGGGGASGQIASTNAAIHRATGFTPCLFRPPYGSTGPALRGEVAAADMRSILWDVDPLDWRQPGAAAIASSVLGHVRPGSIVLSHDGGGPRAGTLAAYATIIPALQRRGYTLVTVEELLGMKVLRGA
jgi:peptidoglycan/xylan/chitin deacetylase (PgdA/CDA1 family)